MKRQKTYLLKATWSLGVNHPIKLIHIRKASIFIDFRFAVNKSGLFEKNYSIGTPVLDVNK